MNLKNNVWFFTDGFDKKTCNNIIKNIKKFESKKGKVGGTDNQTELNKKPGTLMLGGFKIQTYMKK